MLSLDGHLVRLWIQPHALWTAVTKVFLLVTQAVVRLQLRKRKTLGVLKANSRVDDYSL